MAAAKLPPARRGGGDTGFAGDDVDGLDWRKNPGVALRRRIEERKRRLARIDREVAIAEQRRGTSDAKSIAQLLALEEAARQPRRAAHLVLAHERVTIEHIAGEIERIPWRHV